MTYTADDGEIIQLSLARSRNPFDRTSWERMGPVFPDLEDSSAAGALLIRDSPPHYMFWG